jgi:hypothetical protein
MSFVLKTSDIGAMASGRHTTVAASDSVTTGLREVTYATATLQSDPILAVSNVTVDIPDQIANPGKITIKTWKATSASDTTPIAATTFSKNVQWICYGR